MTPPIAGDLEVLEEVRLHTDLEVLEEVRLHTDLEVLEEVRLHTDLVHLDLDVHLEVTDGNGHHAVSSDGLSPSGIPRVSDERRYPSRRSRSANQCPLESTTPALMLADICSRSRYGGSMRG